MSHPPPWHSVSRGWNHFWFSPTSTAPLAVLRIVFGLVATAWFISLAPDLMTFFGPRGLMPEPPPLGPGSWTLFTLLDSGAAIVTMWVVAMAASLALTVGRQTRLASVLVFVAIVSFERRNNMVFNGGDGLLRNIALVIALAPAGAALSWDRWRADRSRFWEAPLHAPWALRLLQVQVSVVYLSTVWAKLQGRTWGDGFATSFALRIGDLQRVPTPSFLTDSLIATNIMTFGALGLEFAIGVLVWNRAARPWVLTLGVVFHLMIELTMVVGFFSIIMITAYLSFLSPRSADRLIAPLRDRLGRRNRTVTKPPARSDVEDVTGAPGATTSQEPQASSHERDRVMKGME